jgi:lipase
MSEDPFAAAWGVPVAGGVLGGARAGPPPERASAVVLAVHGVASSHAIWRTVARALEPSICFLAPDLRGRGASVSLPGPYGIAAHVVDLLAVLDQAGVRRALVVGHSLGAYVAAVLAAGHPGRVSGVVLLDGGLAVPQYPADVADELVEAMVDSALEHARPPVDSVEEHVGRWRSDGSLGSEWDRDVEAYARSGVTGEPGALHAAVSEAAVRADLAGLVRDESVRSAVDRVAAPLTFMRARRPARATIPAIPQTLVESFAGTHPRARVEEVADANHYTLVLGAGPGPRRVAGAITAALARA